MKILQVPILYCYRCENQFTPRLDPVGELVIIPKCCPNRDCRSHTWNIPDDELEIIKQVQRGNLLLGPRYRKGIRKKIPVLDKYKPKKNEKKPLVVCVDCELFFYDDESLKRHQHRRHHGMCRKCHSSNVYVVIRDGITICKTCFLCSKK